MQVVGYRPRHESPAELRIATDGRVETESLAPGTELTYRLGDRHCAGTVEEARHVPCSESAAPYCDRHADRWACARCRGECDLPLETCREPHVVYLAAFAPEAFKVGVTREWRLERRLREQGADRGALLHTVTDGRTARAIEAEIATTVGDRVRTARKIEGLHEALDTAAWEALLSDRDVRETFAFEYGLDLLARPVPEVLAAGTVRGTKGRVLVVERGGTDYAVDLRALVGYEVDPAPLDRDLQTSLGAFE